MTYFYQHGIIKVSSLVLQRESKVHRVRLTMREGDLEWLSGVSEIPHRQAAVWVTAHELLPFMVPADWMDGL